MQPITSNTLFLMCFMLSSICYTATQSAPISVLGGLMFGFMLLFIVKQLVVEKIRVRKSDFFLFLGLVLYYAGHITFTNARIENIALSLSVVLFFICLKYSPIYPSRIAQMLLFIWLISIVLNMDDFIKSFSASRVVDYFSGFFHNSNTFAAYSLVVFSSTLLFISSKRIKWLVGILFIVCLFAHHSRNILLFFALLPLFYTLFNKGKDRLALGAFVAITSGAFIYLTVIEPNIKDLTLVVFGKNADTAGRSAQVFTIIKNFSLNFLGYSSDVIGAYVLKSNRYALHNAWINTIYSMGVLYVVFYIVFIRGIYQNLSIISKTILLCSHIYFFFEPGLFFSILMVSSFPIIIVIITLHSIQSHENSTLHI